MLRHWISKKINYLKNLFTQLVLKERSPHKLAASLAVGVYIAFSPFLFCHTIMVFAFSWMFSLNLPAVFVGACVNNPWTLIPCSLAAYGVGDFFLKTVCRLDPLALNPSWMSFLNGPLFKVTGIKGLSFWSFMVGGNLLGLLAGAMLYPILKHIFSRLGVQKYQGAKKAMMEDHENSCAEQKGVPRLRHPRQTGSRDRIDRR